MKRAIRALALWTAVLSAACATTPEAQPSPEPTASTPEPAPGAPPAAAATSAAPAANPQAAPPPAGGTRTADGIDDDTWLPTSGAARDKFLSAVETLRRDPKAAVGEFVDAANKTTYFYAAWFNAGAAAEMAGDVATAEKHYRQTLQVRRDYGPALINLTALLDRAGRSAEADRIVADALKASPDRAGPHLAAASRAMGKGDAATAERESLEALRYDERAVPAMQLMARVFMSQKRYDTARFALENALAVEPGNALLHFELGKVLLAQADDKAATASFEKAARLRPSLAEAQEQWGLLLLKAGQNPEALAALDRAAKLSPNAASTQLHHGNALRANKRYPDAEAAYTRALTLNPALHEANFNLGVLYIDNGVGPSDELARLEKGVAALKAFQAAAKPEGELARRVAETIDGTEKRIQREKRTRERDEKRKREEAAKPAAEAKPNETPADGAAKPAAGGADG